MDLDVLVGAGAGVAEGGGEDGDLAARLGLAARVDDAQRARLQAVDAPVGVADVVADGDGEAAEVGAHDVDDGALLAVDLQRRVLAAVLGPPLVGCRRSACKGRREGRGGFNIMLISCWALLHFSRGEMKSLTNGGSGCINGINNGRARQRHGLKEDSNYLIHCYSAEGRGRKRNPSPGM